jgi:hypothetical protein
VSRILKRSCPGRVVVVFLLPTWKLYSYVATLPKVANPLGGVPQLTAAGSERFFHGFSREARYVFPLPARCYRRCATPPRDVGCHWHVVTKLSHALAILGVQFLFKVNLPWASGNVTLLETREHCQFETPDACRPIPILLQ